MKLYEWPDEIDTITCPECSKAWEWDWCGDTLTSREIIGIDCVEEPDPNFDESKFKMGCPASYKCVCGCVLVTYDPELAKDGDYTAFLTFEYK